jgi:TolB protein
VRFNYFYLWLLTILLIPTSALTAAKPSLGQFEAHIDVGDTHMPGAASYDSMTDVYRVTGGGESIWGTQDGFHFVWRRRSGDVAIGADVSFPLPSPTPHRKAGVMIRQSLDPDSPFVDVLAYGIGLTALQYREVKGGIVQDIETYIKSPRSIRLERVGDYAAMSVTDTDGQLHRVAGPFKLKLTQPYYIGLAVTAHDNTRSESALFSHVSIVPIRLGMGVPVLSSSLETIAIAAAHDRHVIYQTQGYIESPNWSPDGKFFLFDRGGHLYRLPAQVGQSPTLIETGPLHKINDDHGISPDGSLVAVSDASQPDGIARIYVLPVTGSQVPRLVAGDFASYWHGWAPNGKSLVYSGRPSKAAKDQYLYSAFLADRSGARLTDMAGFDGAPDYSADGKYIYFNSIRSGNMKIWRIDVDGSHPVQITNNDDTRDWFPHPSPDGKWIAFLSYETDVAVQDHAANRDVKLCLIPATGGKPQVIAKLFGGEGTLNVPAWSPDAKQIAIMTYRLDQFEIP